MATAKQNFKKSKWALDFSHKYVTFAIDIFAINNYTKYIKM